MIVILGLRLRSLQLHPFNYIATHNKIAMNKINYTCDNYINYEI